MTHYWWMHWFWITAYLNPVACNSTIITERYAHAQLKNESFFRTSKSVEGPSYIPPISVTPAKALGNVTTQIVSNRKSNNKSTIKKTDFNFGNTTKSNNNNNNGNTTVYPPFKETTVIDQNITDFSLNNTDNQTLVNTSFNVIINHNENITYVGDDNIPNRTEFLNSECTGADKIASGSLSVAGITGITFGCVAIVGIICAISFFMYRNRGFNRPQVLNDRCSNPDSSGYIDDASVRDNSEEMYSLDNDSFLNSLEAMTIQNYFTDTVKHTKL